MRVAWLCHFTDKEVQEILKPHKPVREMAPWIPAMAQLFEKQDRVRLDIISPHEYISGTRTFSLRGINYHFFNAHIPFWGRHWPGRLKVDYWTNFRLSKRKIGSIVGRIKPDVIHLHGAENAYYSSGILQFNGEYPVLITPQGFIAHTLAKGPQILKRQQVEKAILRSFHHFGYRTRTMGDQIREFNAEARLHWHHYPVNIPEFRQTPKKYDIVFFARVSKDKGIEDLLRACKIIRNRKPALSVCIVGRATESYRRYLEDEIRNLGLTDNVDWIGFLPDQKDVHALASSARISVLPTYHDIISGTIIESLFLKLPVVSYNVGSIHEVNDKEEIVRLVEKGDIRGMTEQIETLLADESLIQEVGEKGYLRAKEMFNYTEIVQDLVNAYEAVISDFNKSWRN